MTTWQSTIDIKIDVTVSGTDEEVFNKALVNAINAIFDSRRLPRPEIEVSFGAA